MPSSNGRLSPAPGQGTLQPARHGPLIGPHSQMSHHESHRGPQAPTTAFPHELAWLGQETALFIWGFLTAPPPCQAEPSSEGRSLSTLSCWLFFIFLFDFLLFFKNKQNLKARKFCSQAGHRTQPSGPGVWGLLGEEGL